ncbi:hypothetical protein FOZ63_014870, partial [Perkinsus olseni]
CITGLRRLKYIIHEYTGPLLEAYLQHTLSSSSLTVNADHGDEEQGRDNEILILLSTTTRACLKQRLEDRAAALQQAVTALPALDPHYDVTSLYDDIDDDHHQDDDGSIGGKVYRIHTTEGERALSTRATATAGVEEEQQQQQSMMLSTATTAVGAALIKTCTDDNFQRGTEH